MITTLTMYVQAMLKKQFPCLEGLQLTLLQEKNQDKIQNGIRIIFCRSHQHWVVASTIACGKNEVKVYGSVFNATEIEARKTFTNLFKLAKKPFICEKFQKQIGHSDCGLFSIATTTAIALV